MFVGVSALMTPATPRAGLPPCSSRTFASVRGDLVPRVLVEDPDVHRVKPTARPPIEDVAVRQSRAVGKTAHTRVGIVKFSRDTRGTVTGFAVNGVNARGVRFDRNAGAG